MCNAVIANIILIKTITKKFGCLAETMSNGVEWYVLNGC
jgi:hypothetical protein